MTIDQLIREAHGTPRLLVPLRGFSGNNRRGRFQCYCGNIFITTIDHVKRGHTKSCGCLTKKINRSLYTKHLESGKRRTAEYQTWYGMIQRCTNSRSKAWKWYGARGITVCNAWRKSYQQFLLDMGRKPSPSYSIDRIDNNGHYTPTNCRWATKSQQNYNKRKLL